MTICEHCKKPRPVMVEVTNFWLCSRCWLDMFKKDTDKKERK
jgi:hypothetical protein